MQFHRLISPQSQNLIEILSMGKPLRLNSDEHIHFFESNMKPAASIDLGTRIIIHTMDALEGRAFDQLEFGPEDVNPATGPIFINGARPGDVLAVHILSIRPINTGYAGAGSGTQRIVRQFHVIGDEIRFSDDISLEMQPMIGVIGVAPREGGYSSMVAGDHGGNMDCNLARAGATIYLPIFTEGGLLAMGDVHAIMGDGEVSGQGIEVAADIEIEVGIGKWRLRRPLIETDEVWATVAAARDLMAAARTAVGDIVDYVEMKFGLSSSEALLLVSLAGNVRVCQIVTDMPTARVELPKRLMRNV